MPTFKLNPSYAWKAMVVQCQGSFTDSNPAVATVNRQINPANITVSVTNGGSIGSDSAEKPVGTTPFAVFAQPRGGQPPAAANTQYLPTGMTTTAPTAGEYVIDCSAWAADIIGAQATLCPHVRGQATPQTAYVSAIDNVNKLIYIQVLSFAGAAASIASGATQICFDVVMSDSYAS